MASSDKHNYDEFGSDHSDDNDSDDSLEDPTFDIVEGTRSKFSTLSIHKKSKPRLEEQKVDNGEGKGNPDVMKDQDSYQSVEEVIKAGQLEKLKADQCKVYLRKHGLRLTGNKDTLIQRIREHLDVIDGGGERKYPVSSFLMNCKGDACAGDVVLFEQNVYEMFNIASRSANGPPCGTRLVAGRIVKESYGSEKQQHTFTIEVLWSKGEKPLPPLHQLLIKGRNLYRLKTMRQEWEDETERIKMLSEKHARGYLARSNRETRIREREMRKMLRLDRMKAADEKKRTPKQQPEDSLSNLQFQNFQPKDRGELKSCKNIASAGQEGPVSLLARPKLSLDVNVPLERHHHRGREPLTSKNFNLPGDTPRTAIHEGQIKLEKSMNPVQTAPHCERHTNRNCIISRSRGPSDSTTRRDEVHVWSSKRIHFRGENLIAHRNPVQGHLQEKNQPCRYFARGRCYYGDRCRWLHEEDSGNQKQQ